MNYQVNINLPEARIQDLLGEAFRELRDHHGYSVETSNTSAVVFGRVLGRHCGALLLDKPYPAGVTPASAQQRPGTVVPLRPRHEKTGYSDFNQWSVEVSKREAERRAYKELDDLLLKLLSSPPKHDRLNYANGAS